MTCPQEANVVVVGVDDTETSFTFDALVENEEGECRLNPGGLKLGRHQFRLFLPEFEMLVG